MCTRCSERNINCMYRSEEDGRKPASKSYVQLLRNRIDLLEAVLQSHSIDIEASVAQLTAAGTTPQLNAVSTALAPGSSDPALAGLSPSAFDDLCTTFEGALSLDESVNYDQDGEMRYFGPSSGRLEFQTGKCHSTCVDLTLRYSHVPRNHARSRRSRKQSCNNEICGIKLLYSPTRET